MTELANTDDNIRPFNAQTALDEEFARRSQRPVAVLSALVDEAKAQIIGWRRQKEVLEAGRKTQVDAVESEFARRAAERATRLAELTAAIAAINDAEDADRKDATDRRKRIEGEIDRQWTALDRMISSHQNMVQDLENKPSELPF